MELGVPRETSPHEHRVGLTPFAVAQLAASGHPVYVQSGAGEDCHFQDEDYLAAGASVVYSAEEAYQRSDIVCRIGSIPVGEVELLRPGQVVCGFQHLAVSPREYVQELIEREITLIGYELIEDAAGDRPVLRSRSEIAGHQVIWTAAQLLAFDGGGRGVILGGLPGIPPATVVILGAGTVGRIAAGLAHASGAHVIVLDEDLAKLRKLFHDLPAPVVTAVASQRNLASYTAIADVFIGAVSRPGERSPFLVTTEMVEAMKPGAVVLDLSIDEGGCVATSRPTTPADSTYTVHGVTHYCVPDITANVPRTASRAAALASLPYLLRLARVGVDWALAGDPGLARGAYLYKGWVTNRPTAKLLDSPYRSLSGLLPVDSGTPSEGR